MDDLKLIVNSEEELQKEIQTVKNFSYDIHIEFGLEKCANVTFKRDKLTHSQNLVMDTNREIQEPEQEKMYKYLGIEEIYGINLNDGEISSSIRRYRNCIVPPKAF